MKESQLKVGMNYEDIFLIYGLDRDIAYYVQEFLHLHNFR